MPVEEDALDVGFTTYDYGCNACPTKFEDGQPVRERIEPRGKWMCCVKCGGSYGSVPVAEGWCTSCGCGNDSLGYAHAPLCQRLGAKEVPRV
jgi:hypothetical protein